MQNYFRFPLPTFRPTALPRLDYGLMPQRSAVQKLTVRFPGSDSSGSTEVISFQLLDSKLALGTQYLIWFYRIIAYDFARLGNFLVMLITLDDLRRFAVTRSLF